MNCADAADAFHAYEVARCGIPAAMPMPRTAEAVQILMAKLRAVQAALPALRAVDACFHDTELDLFAVRMRLIDAENRWRRLIADACAPWFGGVA